MFAPNCDGKWQIDLGRRIRFPSDATPTYPEKTDRKVFTERRRVDRIFISISRSPAAAACGSGIFFFNGNDCTTLTMTHTGKAAAAQSRDGRWWNDWRVDWRWTDEGYVGEGQVKLSFSSWSEHRKMSPPAEEICVGDLNPEKCTRQLPSKDTRSRERGGECARKNASGGEAGEGRP